MDRCDFGTMDWYCCRAKGHTGDHYSEPLSAPQTTPASIQPLQPSERGVEKAADQLFMHQGYVKAPVVQLITNMDVQRLVEAATVSSDYANMSSKEWAAKYPVLLKLSPDDREATIDAMLREALEPWRKP